MMKKAKTAKTAQDFCARLHAHLTAIRRCEVEIPRKEARLVGLAWKWAYKKDVPNTHANLEGIQWYCTQMARIHSITTTAAALAEES